MNKKNYRLKDTFELALKNYQKRDLKTAELFCKKVLSIDTNHFDSIFLLSIIAATNNDFNEAKKLLEKAKEIEPNNLRVYNNLGNVYKELKNINESINCYKKIIEIDPKHINAHYNLGLAYYGLRNLRESKKYFQKTVQMQPDYALAFFNLGSIHGELKEWQEAIEAYQSAIKIRSNFASAYNNMGLIYRAMSDYKNAINCYQEVIKINPKNVGAYNNLGMAYKEIGDFKKAIEAHSEATKIDPENLHHLFYLNELKPDFLETKLIPKIEKIINDRNATKKNIAYGNFLLAKFKNNKKEYEKEFTYLLKAHSNFFEFRKEKFELGIKYCFNELLQIVDNANITTKKKNADYNIKPIFIVGVPRCGSTLVEKIIGSGKKSFPMGEEANVIEDYVNKKILQMQSVNLGDVEQIRTEITKIYKQKNLIDEKSNYVFSDKSLNNFFYIPLLKKIFPRAKIINCRRNVLSSITSIFQNNLTELSWAHNPEHIFKYFDIYFRIINSFKEKYAETIYELKFEQLLNDPEAESKKLMEFCELPWDKKCLEFYKRKNIISKTASFQQVRRAIYKHPEAKYLPYKRFLDKYGNKYSWYKNK